MIFTPSPFTSIMAEDFQAFDASNWKTAGGWSWAATVGVCRQTSTDGYGRVVTGPLIDDQVVHVRVKRGGLARDEDARVEQTREDLRRSDGPRRRCSWTRRAWFRRRARPTRAPSPRRMV